MNVRSTLVLVEPCEGGHAVGQLGGDPAGEGDRVAADIPQRTAALGRIDPRIVRIGQEERERPVDQLEPPERAAPGELDRAQDLRVVEVHEPFHRDPPGPVGGGDDGVDVVDGQRERFLAQDVLARLECADRPLGMEVVGQRDVDDVHVRRRDEVVIRPERPGDAVACREVGGSTRIPAGDARQLAPVAGRDGPDEPGRDPARPEDAPPERGPGRWTHGSLRASHRAFADALDRPDS